MPRPSRLPSCAPGSPLPLEKRTVVRTGSPWRCAARVRPAPSGLAVKVPSQTTPFACAARKPRCTPLTPLMASTRSSLSPTGLKYRLLAAGEDRRGGLAALRRDPGVEQRIALVPRAFDRGDRRSSQLLLGARVRRRREPAHLTRHHEGALEH